MVLTNYFIVRIDGGPSEHAGSRVDVGDWCVAGGMTEWLCDRLCSI